MDLDAVITFKRVLKEENITNEDKMLLISAINNDNIDINLSIIDNLKLINKDGISADDLFFYLDDFLGKCDHYLEVPIYLLLLARDDLRDLLISAYKRLSLKEESVLVISEEIFKYLESENNQDCEQIVYFFNNLLAVRKPDNYQIFQNSFSVISYVYKNLASIYNGCNIYNKALITTLISFGYIDLEMMSQTFSDNYSCIGEFIKELLDHELYMYIKTMFNTRTVSSDLAVFIKNTINDYLSDYQDNPRFKHFIISFNDKLDNIIKKKVIINRH